MNFKKLLSNEDFMSIYVHKYDLSNLLQEIFGEFTEFFQMKIMILGKKFALCNDKFMFDMKSCSIYTYIIYIQKTK